MGYEFVLRCCGEDGIGSIPIQSVMDKRGLDITRLLQVMGYTLSILLLNHWLVIVMVHTRRLCDLFAHGVFSFSFFPPRSFLPVIS